MASCLGSDRWWLSLPGTGAGGVFVFSTRDEGVLEVSRSQLRLPFSALAAELLSLASEQAMAEVNQQ